METAEFAHRAVQGRFDRQSKVRWWVEVHAAGSTLFQPEPPVLEQFLINGEPAVGLTRVQDVAPDFGRELFILAPGQDVQLTVHAPSVEALPALNQTASMGAFLAGQLVALQEGPPGQWNGAIQAPAIPGVYRLSVFGSNTVTDGLDSAQAAAGRSVEVLVLEP